MSPAPILSSFAENIYSEFAPLTKNEEATAYALAQFIGALGLGYQPVDDVARDSGAYPGWSSVLDADRAPAYFLTWLGQFVGISPMAGLTVAQTRIRIKAREGWARGTPAAIKTVVQRFLTGTKEVLIVERDSSPYHFAIVTRTSETPGGASADIVLAVTREQKPAGLQFSHTAVPGRIYTELESLYANYAAIDAGNTDYTDVES